MPYIDKDQRSRLEPRIFAQPPTTAGELNYVITRTVVDYLNRHKNGRDFYGQPKTGNNYDDYNTVIGVLESAKLEVYRRMVAPYEETKIEQNGDVY